MGNETEKDKTAKDVNISAFCDDLFEQFTFFKEFEELSKLVDRFNLNDIFKMAERISGQRSICDICILSKKEDYTAKHLKFGILYYVMDENSFYVLSKDTKQPVLLGRYSFLPNV